ncbi:hypothetical protein TNCV_2040591 [Trichonephila clavipes]|nr:hypothetical protein TNCV_2040591 [Trichonephila clavipes]
MVFPNEVYTLGEEVENIVISHNYIGKHGRKQTGGAVREKSWSALVVSSFQTRTARDEHDLLYESQIGGYPLHLKPTKRKRTCCFSVAWRKISSEVAIESSNVHWSASEPGRTFIFQRHD